MFSNQPAAPFDGFRTIAAHIEQRNKLEDYIHGISKSPPDIKLTNCDADCLFAKWSHNQGCKGFKDIKLLYQICVACETFHSAASQAVLLMNMGKEDLAKKALQDGGIYSNASSRFQREVTRLHIQLNTTP